MIVFKLLQYLGGKMVVYLSEKMLLNYINDIPYSKKSYLLQVEIENLYNHFEKPNEYEDENEYVIIDWTEKKQLDIQDSENFSYEKSIFLDKEYEIHDHMKCA
jgi:hypothetical protein